MEAATSAFLSRIGLAPGWASLDVGCGDGQVTIAMARIVGPGGRRGRRRGGSGDRAGGGDARRGPRGVCAGGCIPAGRGRDVRRADQPFCRSSNRCAAETTGLIPGGQ